MAESLEAFAELASLRLEVAEVGSMVDALVRHSGTATKDKILEEMSKDATLAEIYRLIDGERGGADILAELKKRPGFKTISQPTVSRKLTKLAQDMSLIVLDHRSTGGNVYRHGRLDRVLGISRALKQTGTRRGR